MMDSTYAMFQQLASEGGSFSCQKAEGNGDFQVVSNISTFGITDRNRLSESCKAEGVTLKGSSPHTFIAIGPPDRIKSAIERAKA